LACLLGESGVLRVFGCRKRIFNNGILFNIKMDFVIMGIGVLLDFYAIFSKTTRYAFLKMVIGIALIFFGFFTAPIIWGTGVGVF
jgi:hypothetical protein